MVAAVAMVTTMKAMIMARKAVVVVTAVVAATNLGIVTAKKGRFGGLF
jgi:hypothetical protein